MEDTPKAMHVQQLIHATGWSAFYSNKETGREEHRWIVGWAVDPVSRTVKALIPVPQETELAWADALPGFVCYCRHTR